MSPPRDRQRGIPLIYLLTARTRLVELEPDQASALPCVLAETILDMSDMAQEEAVWPVKPTNRRPHRVLQQDFGL